MDRRDRTITEVLDGVAELLGGALPGPRPPDAEPEVPLGRNAERRLPEGRVGVGAGQQAVLHVEEEAFGVGLAAEGLRPVGLVGVLGQTAW